MSEQKVLLVTLEERNGEHEYMHQCYFENSDEENKPTERYVLGQFFGKLDEEDELDLLSHKGWWIDDRIVSVYSFEMVSVSEIEVLKKHTCIPLINEEDSDE
jgi:hypothetical protein